MDRRARKAVVLTAPIIFFTPPKEDTERHNDTCFSFGHEMENGKLERPHGSGRNKLSRQFSMDLDETSNTKDTLQIPEIHVTCCNKTLSPPLTCNGLEIKFPSDKIFPSISCNNSYDTEGKDNLHPRNDSYGTQRRRNSGESIGFDSQPHKKLKSLLFRKISRSSDSLDKVSSSPDSKLPAWQRLHRSVSVPHAEFSNVRTEYDCDVREGNTNNQDSSLSDVKSLTNGSEVEKNEICLETSQCEHTNDLRERTRVFPRTPNIFFVEPPNEQREHQKDDLEIINDKPERQDEFVRKKLPRQFSLNDISFFRRLSQKTDVPSSNESSPTLSPTLWGETEFKFLADDINCSVHGDNCVATENASSVYAGNEQSSVVDSQPHKKLKSFLSRSGLKSCDSLDAEESGSFKSKLPLWRRLQRSASVDKAAYICEVHKRDMSIDESDIKSLTVGLELERKKIHAKMSQCIRTDECKCFRSFLKKRLVDVNMMYDGDGSLLHDASYKGCTKCMKALLKGGSYVNLCDNTGWTALHAAVLGRNVDAIKLLIKNNALPNQLSSDGLSPCHLGVFTNNIYIIHELVRAGGDPLLTGPGTTPFQLAIDLEKHAVLDYFLHMSCFLVDNISKT